jgi:mannobiose 2-epimerase
MSFEQDFADWLRHQLTEGILARWYPRVVDRECGGYFTNFSSEWKRLPEQEKMVVSQARHVWTLSKAAGLLEDSDRFLDWARHGEAFLLEKLWDAELGGFFQIRSREGGYTDEHGWREEKRTYGNAFALYALAALFERTRDPQTLAAAQRAFRWIEEKASDRELGGYFQFLRRDGTTFGRGDEYRTLNKDAPEVGYKDQNSSIHLLEAYTELFQVWPDPTLRTQLTALLALLRDRMVHPRGYLRLFFERDFTPVSFRGAAEQVRRENYGLAHVSFGHDYETAFLMLEASYALGLENDGRTLMVAKRMLDHALEAGWDEEAGGFFDGGYYEAEEGRCVIVRDTKTWWAQAEGLNALALFSAIFPDEPRYRVGLQRQWKYIDRWLIDRHRGDWFEGGLDKEPHFQDGPKSHLWKCTYHTGRTLMNCLALVGQPGAAGLGEKFAARKRELASFVEHWRAVASSLPG